MIDLSLDTGLMIDRSIDIIIDCLIDQVEVDNGGGWQSVYRGEDLELIDRLIDRC